MKSSELSKLSEPGQHLIVNIAITSKVTFPIFLFIDQSIYI